MASIGKLLTPGAGGGCGVNLDWRHSSENPGCLSALHIISSQSYLAVNFSARGKVGLSCGGTDAYVDISATGISVNIDVWKALADGVWSSSVTVDIYIAWSAALTRNVSAEPSGNSPAKVTKSVTAEAIACGTIVKATVTVNSDGTFSIA